MKNRVAIQRVQSLYSKGTQSRSTRLLNRHIFSVLSTLRNKLLTQEHKKNQRLSHWVYQSIPCMTLEEVPLNECPCTPQSGCTILRTKEKIPALLVGKRSHLLLVTGMEGQLNFSETTWEGKKYKSGNRYTKLDPDFFLRDQRIYITVTKVLETISVMGVFENPISVYNTPDCTGQIPCLNNLELDFPFEEDLMDGLIELAANELIGKFASSREDVTNNSMDSPINETR